MADWIQHSFTESIEAVASTSRIMGASFITSPVFTSLKWATSQVGVALSEKQWPTIILRPYSWISSEIPWIAAVPWCLKMSLTPSVVAIEFESGRVVGSLALTHKR
jgi:hypothetical protein